MKVIDAFKMAWVGFAEEMKWSYKVTHSSGTSFSRGKIKLPK